MSMFSKRINAALFAIAVVSSLVTISLVGSAFATNKKSVKFSDTADTMLNVNAVQKIASQKSHGEKANDPDDTGGVSKKALKTLSKCQSASATDGDVTLADVNDCYSQAFKQEHDKPKGSNTAQGKDQPENAHEQQQLRSSPLNEPKSVSMREGFNF